MRMREGMKAGAGTLAVVLGAVACALLGTGSGAAQCTGIQATARAHARTANWTQQMRPRLLRTAYGDADQDAGKGEGKDAIVGMWHFQFWAPDPTGAEVDAGYQQWHSDGTEITNSGLRSPSSGDFCLGVWQRVGERIYKLNHFTTSWDPTGTVLLGTGHIQEQVTVAPDGQSFSGTFSITQYDESMHVLGGVSGTVLATRVTVNSAPGTVH